MRAFWLLAFGITWGAGALALLVAAMHPAAAFTSSHPLYYIAGWGPTLAALLVTARTAGLAGVRALLLQVRPTRAGLPWYLAVLVGYPVLLLAVGRLVAPEAAPPLPLSQLVPLLALTLLRDTGPLGEELGWRGVGLPRLLQRWSPLRAGVLLGIIWGVWHLPAFFIGTLSQSHLSLPMFVLGTVSLTLIMTWLYLRTGGDLLLMILVHLVTNFAVGNLGIGFDLQVMIEAAVAALIVGLGGLRATRSPYARGTVAQ